MTEKDLLLKIRNKDKAAFDNLFRLYYKPLCVFCYNMLRDKTIAEEIVQEFFISLWESAPMVTDSVKSYFYKSIYNRTLNHIEKAKTRLKNEEKYSSELESDADSDLEEGILQNQINKAVDELPEKCKEIFVMCKYNEMSYAQVSELLAISPKTVENQMGIALKKLRERLSPYFGRKK